jgi:hypothetical protein
VAAHYFEQCADLTADPEVTFEVAGADWQLVAFQWEGLGVYQEAGCLRDDGRSMMAPKLLEELRTFAHIMGQRPRSARQT